MPNLSFFKSFFCFLIVLPLLGSILGCGESGPETFVVRGQVTYQDKLLDHGGVSFYPAKGAPTNGAIRADGSYEAHLVAGEYGVAIFAPPVQLDSSPGAPPPVDPNPLPTKYSRPTTSGLKATVEVGKSDTQIDFNLK